MTELKTISPKDAAELVRKGAVLIDIRDEDEHARERIPGARHHALSRLDAETLLQAGDEILVFHCRSGARPAATFQGWLALQRVAKLTFSMEVSTLGRRPVSPSDSIDSSRSN